MAQAVIVSGARTPFGKFGGSLATLSAVQLGGIAIKGALERSGIAPEQVQGVIMGMVNQAGAGQIPSRQAARLAGLGWEVQSETINKVCASGMRSVTMAEQFIRAGDADTLIAGGMESMSNVPYALPAARWGGRMGHGEMVDLLLRDGLICSFDGVHMGVHGSNVAKEYGISRQAQDEWALRSHQKVVQAQDAGWLAEEIVPVPLTRKREQVMVEQDEAPRRDSSLERLAQLAPAFEKEGSITAGNAPGVNDGAAALLVMSEERAKSQGIRPLARILGHAAIGMEARYLAATPGYAIQALLKKTGVGLSEVKRIEVNEAFAAVPLVSAAIAGLDLDKTNVNGGAVALGHPIGASGTRIILTLVLELRRVGGGLGIAAICSGAAQGDAILLEVDPQ